MSERWRLSGLTWLMARNSDQPVPRVIGDNPMACKVRDLTRYDLAASQKSVIL